MGGMETLQSHGSKANSSCQGGSKDGGGGGSRGRGNSNTPDRSQGSGGGNSGGAGKRPNVSNEPLNPGENRTRIP